MASGCVLRIMHEITLFHAMCSYQGSKSFFLHGRRVRNVDGTLRGRSWRAIFQILWSHISSSLKTKWTEGPSIMSTPRSKYSAMTARVSSSWESPNGTPRDEIMHGPRGSWWGIGFTSMISSVTLFISYLRIGQIDFDATSSDVVSQSLLCPMVQPASCFIDRKSRKVENKGKTDRTAEPVEIRVTSTGLLKSWSVTFPLKSWSTSSQKVRHIYQKVDQRPSTSHSRPSILMPWLLNSCPLPWNLKIPAAESRTWTDQSPWTL
jgi:hypothetical protein